MRLSRMLAVAVLVFASGAVIAQEKVENPAYTNWAKFKKGTSITMSMTSKVGAIASESVTTTKLVDVTADKVVIEITNTTKVMGMDFKAEPMKVDIEKMVALPKGFKKEDVKKPEGATKEGTETLKIAGAEIKTKWYEVETKVMGMDIKSKTWMSDDVPGMMVKMETQSSGANATTMKMELTEFKKP